MPKKEKKSSSTDTRPKDYSQQPQTSIAENALKNQAFTRADSGKLPLFVNKNDFENAKKLLDAGVSPNSYALEGIFKRPAIYYAILNGDNDIALLLINHPVFDPNFKILDYDFNILNSQKIDQSSFEDEKQVDDKYLVKSSLLDLIMKYQNHQLFDAFLNLDKTDCKSAIFSAIQYGNRYFVRQILAKNPKLAHSVTERLNQHESHKNITPLGLATITGDTIIVKLLVEKYQVDIEKGRKGITPLFLAIFYGHIDIVGYLLFKGANPYAMQSGVSVDDKIQLYKDRIREIEEKIKKPHELESQIDSKKSVHSFAQGKDDYDSHLEKLEKELQFYQEELKKNQQKSIESDVKKNRSILDMVITERDVKYRDEIGCLLALSMKKIDEKYLYLAIEYGEKNLVQILLLQGVKTDKEKVKASMDKLQVKCGYENITAVVANAINQIEFIESQTEEIKNKVIANAVRNGNAEIVDKLLLRLGITPQHQKKIAANIFQEHYLTEYAARAANASVLKYLIDQGAYFDPEIDYLSKVLIHEDYTILALLVKQNVKSPQKATYEACRLGRVHHLRILLNHFGDDNLFAQEAGKKPFDVAMSYCQEQHDPAILIYLINERKIHEKYEGILEILFEVSYANNWNLFETEKTQVKSQTKLVKETRLSSAKNEKSISEILREIESLEKERKDGPKKRKKTNKKKMKSESGPAEELEVSKPIESSAFSVLETYASIKKDPIEEVIDDDLELTAKKTFMQMEELINHLSKNNKAKIKEILNEAPFILYLKKDDKKFINSLAPEDQKTILECCDENIRQKVEKILDAKKEIKSPTTSLAIEKREFQQMKKSDAQVISK